MKLLVLCLLAGCASEGTLEGDFVDGGGRTGDAAPTRDRGAPEGDGGEAERDAAHLDRGGPVRDEGAVDAAPPQDAAPALDAAPSLPPPAARPPQPPPDESGTVSTLAAQHPDLFEQSCVPAGQASPFLVELVVRLRARDGRWGFIRRNDQVEGDRIGYFWGEGAAEGSRETYVIDVIGSYCPRAGIDNPSTPGWLDDSAAGGTWTLGPLDGSPAPDAGPPPPDAEVPAMLPLPDERALVDALAAERPDLLAASCVADGGNNNFLFELVRRLRARDPRWGLNWKRGNVGDMSQDVVDYFWAQGEPEGRTEVYIIDVISSHCSPDAGPAFTDVTEATREGGTIGRWTLQPLQ